MCTLTTGLQRLQPLITSLAAMASAAVLAVGAPPTQAGTPRSAADHGVETVADGITGGFELRTRRLAPGGAPG